MLSDCAKYLLYSQLSLYGFLAICTVLMPQFLFSHDQGGVSNFGIHNRTIVFYSLAFGLCAAFVYLAATSLPPHTRSYIALKRILLLISAFSLLAVFTTYTYKLTPALRNIHQLSAILLFFVEFFVGLWFGLKLYSDQLNLVFLALMMAGVLAAALTFFGALHVLFVAEVGTGLAFGTIMIWTVHKITMGRNG